jgi:small nuclear ribonucleoprotein (snRNP)-like protein
MKKIIALAIVLSMILPSGALFAKERQGAQLVITKTDGTEIKGELIGIKQDSTLILESSSRIGASIDISDIKVIKIVKGSNTGAGVLLGLFVGGAAGAGIGYGIGHNKPEQNPVGNFVRPLSGAIGTLSGGVIGLFAGGLLGGVIGSSIHDYETFRIEGKSQEQVKAFLEKLRKEARFPEYQ